MLEELIAPIGQSKSDRYVKTLKVNESNITESSLAGLLFDTYPKLVLGFISPHLDFKVIVQKIKRYIPTQTKLILVSSAGELCSLSKNSGGKLYQETGDSWDNIVLESFSEDIISDIYISTIPLASKDIIDQKTIIKDIENNLLRVNVPFKLNHEDTLGLTIVDGLSAQESFFMEAIYNSGKFPVLLVGGSSAGKLDFQKTYIYNGENIVEHCAIITFIKLNKNIQYGVFKSQNFVPTTKTFLTVEADPIQRYIKSVLNPDTLELESFIDVLSRFFKCEKSELHAKLVDYEFAVKIENSYYIRSVSSVDIENDQINLFCDVDFGDEIVLMKKTDFVKQTDNDFANFMKNKKSNIIAAILNDCVLRRLTDSDAIKNIKTFEDIPLIGFSSFGELLGVNINHTLTSIFFFEKDGCEFKDEYVDNFISYYSGFKSYFLLKKIGQLNLILKVKNQLLDKVSTSVPFILQMLDTLQSTIKNSSAIEGKISNIANNMILHMDIIEDNTKNTQAIFHQIQLMQNDIKKIRNSTDASKDIAQQSRILALNASVESTKAGKYGLRFAVVATELGRLSDDTKVKLDTTTKAVNSMYTQFKDTSKQVNASSIRLEGISQKSTAVISGIEDIATIIATTSQQLEAELENTHKLLEDINVISKFEENIKKVDSITITHQTTVLV